MPSAAHPCPQNRVQGAHHPACWLAGGLRGSAQSSPRGVPPRVPPGRAGLWAQRSSTSPLGSRRSAPSPAFQAITWCDRGSAPDAFKEVAPLFRTWDWGSRRGSRGLSLGRDSVAASHSPACAHRRPCAHPVGTLQAPGSCSLLVPVPALQGTLAHRLT